MLGVIIADQPVDERRLVVFVEDTGPGLLPPPPIRRPSS